MSRDSETQAPFLTKERKFTTTLGFVIFLVAVTFAGAVAWSTTKQQVDQNTHSISTLEQKVANDHDLLIEIRGDLKSLVRERDRRADK